MSANESDPIHYAPKLPIIINSVICIVSFFFNSLIIQAICKSRSTYSVLICAVSLAHVLLAGVTVPSGLVARYSIKATMGTLMACKLYKFSQKLTVVGAIHTVLLLAFHSSVVTISGRAMFLLSFIWFFGASYAVWQVVLNTLYLVQIPGDYERNQTSLICFEVYTIKFVKDIFSVTDLLVIYVVPFVVITVLYLRKHSPANSPAQEKYSRWKLSICLTALHFAMQLPNDIYLTYAFYIKDEEDKHFLLISTVLQTFANCHGIGNAALTILSLRDARKRLCCKAPNDSVDHGIEEQAEEVESCLQQSDVIYNGNRTITNT
ncbi:unnamed protein product [Dimorphilus gyrociliatus]|uniref:G-protein coupled receptors family 1 profile domain-containing protein n=1 Tax=Dimorphilus gyrociliatus TaxID=2664684 RepID=A0A7I8VWS1_9ANNE|nr:unnamed protein product [Dimorphilus gyrociliatus]